LYIRVDERDLLKQLIEKAFACKSGLREIVNLSSAYVNEDISIISEKLTIAIKAGYLFLTKSIFLNDFNRLCRKCCIILGHAVWILYGESLFI
jgi:hypothetical protein